MRALGPGSERILRSCLDAIRPRGSGFDQEIDADVVREIDRLLAHLPPSLNLLFPLGLRLLDWGPLLFARPRRFTRMTRMASEDARHYLEGWLEAGGLRGSLLLGVRTLVFLCFYQHPQVLDSLGIDWEGRARELTRVRAERLTGATG